MHGSIEMLDAQAGTLPGQALVKKFLRTGVYFVKRWCTSCYVLARKFLRIARKFSRVGTQVCTRWRASCALACKALRAGTQDRCFLCLPLQCGMLARKHPCTQASWRASALARIDAAFKVCNQPRRETKREELIEIEAGCL